MNIDGWTYQLRYVRCGKPTCRTCTASYGHGPYWYAYRKVDGRTYSRYVGKIDPSTAFPKPPVTDPPIDDRFVFKGKMDGKTALRILGFKVWPTTIPLQRRWRELVGVHHPDRGGDVRICAAINAAYDYLKK